MTKGTGEEREMSISLLERVVLPFIVLFLALNNVESTKSRTWHRWQIFFYIFPCGFIISPWRFCAIFKFVSRHLVIGSSQ
jgi:hypothetical protein